ncbi:hypothetical protein NDU88_000616 [Pleurodeles waltl]|uniref:Uncharacterized protein n=1 Tax=Pleurodeles waltl TaxID=8319 RepID=A0AAV7WG11_PLEWA|nr:hypothetical protein NDU88_000616 [Pleurodeles waltl]
MRQRHSSVAAAERNRGPMHARSQLLNCAPRQSNQFLQDGQLLALSCTTRLTALCPNTMAIKEGRQMGTSCVHGPVHRATKQHDLCRPY